MNAVIYYSNTGACKRIAEYLADKSGYILCDIYGIERYVFDTAILVFPVHCQNVPDAVKDFLSKLKVNALAVVAAYGKMSYGNVLYEVQKKYPHNIAAAAYVPTKHAYLEEKDFADLEKLDVLLEKLKNPSAVRIPKSHKNPFANFAPKLRSRVGVKLYSDAACNGCGICAAVCNVGGINNGKPNKNCIRCLKCVSACPQKALHFKCGTAMRLYLKRRKRDELILYI